MTAFILMGSASLYADLAARNSRATAGISAAIVVRDIRAGSVLTPQDVGVAILPADSPLDPVALQPAEVVGRNTLGDMSAGEMVTSTRLLAGDASPPGYARMPVAFPGEQVAAFLVPGMVIDVVWTPDGFSGESPQVVAHDVHIVKILDAGEGAGPTAGAGSVTALVDVAESDSVRLAASTRSGSLSVLLRQP